MKFTKPNSKSATEGLTMVAGAVGGAMASKGVMSLIPTTQVANTNMYRGALIALSALGLVAVNGTDTAATATKGAFLGMATAQTLQLITDVIPATTTANLKASTTASGKLAASALGLKCPCQDAANQLGKPNHRRRALRSPEFDVTPFYQPQYAIASSNDPFAAVA